MRILGPAEPKCEDPRLEHIIRHPMLLMGRACAMVVGVDQSGDQGLAAVAGNFGIRIAGT